MEPTPARPSSFQRIAPALSLILLAPLLAEVLPGATRFSSIQVFPVEMTIWGGGAVMIRELVRRRRLGWANMLALALALAVAEECIIQQTSYAPLIFYIKGTVWGRSFGINYVYFLWAAVYEAVLVVLLPVMLTELLFPARRQASWLSKPGWTILLVLFALGSLAAWFLWTQIVRVQVFHLGVYNPSAVHLAAGFAAIAVLFWLALGVPRATLANLAAPKRPPAPWLVGLAGAVWALLWFVVEVLAFGIAPDLPPAWAVGGGLLVCAVMLAILPGWTRHPAWSDRHRAWLIAGTMIATMAIFFQAFVGAAPADLLFKQVSNAIAALLFVLLVVRVERRSVREARA
ncbi:MAG: hypothetical protein JO276_13270 [Sphingomonadaceae bacterium]|nr:hypothetical protein [Sphingomonadaceae bacterium]